MDISLKDLVSGVNELTSELRSDVADLSSKLTNAYERNDSLWEENQRLVGYLEEKNQEIYELKNNRAPSSDGGYQDYEHLRIFAEVMTTVCMRSDAITGANCMPQVIQNIRQGRRIDAIKILREYCSIGLKQAKYVVDVLGDMIR